MVRIDDTGALDRLADMEGTAWRLAQLTRPEQPYGFHVVLAAWQELKALGLPEGEASLRDLLPTGEPVIYGEGGYHRYVVYDTGEVRFSKMHAREVNVARAQALGFALT